MIEKYEWTPRLAPGWQEALKLTMMQPQFKSMLNIVEKSHDKQKLVPRLDQVFEALVQTDLPNVAVIILGQDPYPDFAKANGLAFGIKEYGNDSQSFKNIVKELEADIGLLHENFNWHNRTLEGWARQGVLLLNNVLTTEAGQSNAHSHIGWQDFTDVVIRKVLDINPNVPIVAWGQAARSKAAKFAPRNLIESVHPSPQSAHKGFFGSKPFSRVNKVLIANKKAPIRWEF